MGSLYKRKFIQIINRRKRNAGVNKSRCCALKLSNAKKGSLIY
jgi:hypothetical protein